MDGWRTIYRITEDGWPASMHVMMTIAGVGLVVVLCGVLVGLLGVIKWRLGRVAWGLALAVVGGLVGSVGGVLFHSQYLRFSHVVHAYEQGRVRVVEGDVQVLRRQPGAGHAPGDLIEVGGHRYELNYYSGSPGYNTTIAHGGVLVDGRHVQITSVDGSVVELKIRLE